MQFSAKRGLRRTAGDRLCTLVKRRELIPPFVEQSPMDAELLRQRHDVVARLQSLDGHSAEFFRPPTPSLFSHWQFLSLPVCLNELSQIWGSVHPTTRLKGGQSSRGHAVRHKCSLQPPLNRWQSRQAQRNSIDCDQGGTRRFSQKAVRSRSENTSGAPRS
jgi:hypothetical protein